jgi:hypothetical protein
MSFALGLAWVVSSLATACIVLAVREIAALRHKS